MTKPVQKNNQNKLDSFKESIHINSKDTKILKKISEDIQIPLYFTKGVLKGSLALLEGGIKPVIEPIKETSQLLRDPKSFLKEKKQKQIENRLLFKALLKDSKKLVKDLPEISKNKLVKEFNQLLTSSRKELAEKLGEITPTLVGGKLIALQRGVKTVHAVNKLSKIKFSKKPFRLKFDHHTRTWASPMGIKYGLNKKHTTTIKHVLQHLTPDSSKRLHTVFNVGKSELLPLIDEAWIKRGLPLKNDPASFLVEMGRTISNEGSTKIRLVFKNPKSNLIKTAYPEKLK